MSTGINAWLEHVMDCCLPASRVSPAAHLSATITSSDGEDRISALPDALLYNVVFGMVKGKGNEKGNGRLVVQDEEKEDAEDKDMEEDKEKNDQEYDE
ncbi:hypothetical protein ZWY2020_016161 [Hordeum vulgare]|nr:hypothetical protein ZWY2020_016161 [Hordeum vulgare]